MNLAVKGHIAIEERVTPGLLFDRIGYVLRKVKEPGTELAPLERLLMERLFREHDPEVSVSDLKHEFFRNIEDLKKSAFEGLERMKLFGANPLAVTEKYRRAGFLVFLFAPYMPVRIVKGVKTMGARSGDSRSSSCGRRRTGSSG